MSSKQIPRYLEDQEGIAARKREAERFVGNLQAGSALLALLVLLAWLLRAHPGWLFMPHWWGN